MIYSFQLFHRLLSLFVVIIIKSSSSTLAQSSSKYEVKTCLTVPWESCIPQPTTNPIRYQTQPVTGVCEDTVDQAGSLSFVDITLPPNEVLYVEVTTNVVGQENVGADNFYIRPSRLTESWGTPSVIGNVASFYIADTGQFSVEFAASNIWKELTPTLNFNALMLFINPPMNDIPADATLIGNDFNDIQREDGVLQRTLESGSKHYFAADIAYDWGEDMVFHVLDNTEIYFEDNSYVRARFIQTKQKIDNVVISGYGVLDNNYPPTEYDIPGSTDDGSRQAIHLLGKNIHISGLTIVNTFSECGEFGYALNVNANWSPMAATYPANDVFEAGELQNGNPPYSSNRPAHCQENNMDDTPNLDFSNCPSSQDDGAKVSFVKAISWQMGQDGINVGRFGTVADSFVRVVDDAIKPWDSGARYERITIWQLGLGWPINLGWWGWTQNDVDTVVENIYLIHNQNWMTSNDWPTTKSGQCVVGGIYGSSSIKRNYRINNVFVETACSCAIGLEINKAAFSRHLTPEGCVGSILDMSITNLFFDEEFINAGTRTNNFLRGERNPGAECVGDYKGEISNLVISGDVNGRALTESDFVIPKRYTNTVPGITFHSVDTNPSPTSNPSKIPTNAPYTFNPTKLPTQSPVKTTSPPSSPPSKNPTAPSVSPSKSPTNVPSTSNPSPSPSASPSKSPSSAPVTSRPTTLEPTNKITSSPSASPSKSPTDTPTAASDKETVRIVIETPFNPSKVSWKVKIGNTNIITGNGSTMAPTGENNGVETNVELDAGVEYKFVVTDGNNGKDTFWEVWHNGDVLIEGDHGPPCNCRKIVEYFQL